MLAHEAHDPGGKSTFPLPPGMLGGAVFSPCGKYRVKIWRAWGEPAEVIDYSLFCGLNPSTAGGDVNDPTVIREIGFTKRMDLSAYVKVNVSAYRATDPKRLLAPGVYPIWPDNLQAIRDAAADAKVIVMAYGAIHPRLRHLAVEVVNALRADGRELWCLGKTAGGEPRHPLYLKSDAPLVRFP